MLRIECSVNVLSNISVVQHSASENTFLPLLPVVSYLMLRTQEHRLNLPSEHFWNMNYKRSLLDPAVVLHCTETDAFGPIYSGSNL